MKSKIFLTLLTLLPVHGFCDRFWVCDQTIIQEQINDIQKNGGIISDIQVVRLNDYTISYTVKYRTGDDLINVFKN